MWIYHFLMVVAALTLILPLTFFALEGVQLRIQERRVRRKMARAIPAERAQSRKESPVPRVYRT